MILKSPLICFNESGSKQDKFSNGNSLIGIVGSLRSHGSHRSHGSFGSHGSLGSPGSFWSHGSNGILGRLIVVVK